jgi:hypothetical protein
MTVIQKFLRWDILHWRTISVVGVVCGYPSLYLGPVIHTVG